MITTEQLQEIENPPDTFSLKKWYGEMRDGFTAAARHWRNIAHTAQLDCDYETVLMAHGYALQNEAWSKDADRKAQLA